MGSRNSIEFNSVSHSFQQGESLIRVLDDVSFLIPNGGIVGLLGASGSGKTTLLQLAGLLEKPLYGDIKIKGQSTISLNNTGRTYIRRKKIGFVFQKSHLLPEFNALENIIIAQKIFGKQNYEAKENALKLLKEVGLNNRIFHRPGKLSVGEQQRVAIARAVVNNPSVVLADEPTGNLDFENSKNVTDLLIKTLRSSGASALIATHNKDLASKMDKILTLVDGKIKI